MISRSRCHYACCHQQLPRTPPCPCPHGSPTALGDREENARPQASLGRKALRPSEPPVRPDFRRQASRASGSPFLLQRIFQHFDPAHQVCLEVLLPLPFPLEEGHLSLGRQEQTGRQ